MRYLGAGAVSDAFLTAFKLPNSLRKIFAEGALSAALVPSLVNLVKTDNGKHAVAQLISLAFVVFETVVLLLCAFTMVFARTVISLIAPGFSAEQISYAVPFLQILMPFIFFVSSSAIFAGALQAIGHFFIPAISSVLLNIFFIAGIALGLFLGTSVEVLCYCILAGGLAQLITHIIAYRRFGFSFSYFDATTWQTCKHVLIKFVPCLFSMSVAEISLFIDTSFASYLPKGSVTLLYYGNRFMGIPLGVFAVALSTTLLPYFSRISLYARKRMSFYLLETTKLVFWVTVPAAIVMGFFADKVFYTMFYSKNFSLAQVLEARAILIAFLFGLFFFSLNKILMSMFYALHNTTIPAMVAVIATIANIILNFILMYSMRAVGLALATTLSGVLQTILFIWFLYKYFSFKIYLHKFMMFVRSLLVQIIVIFSLFGVIYKGMVTAVSYSDRLAYYALDTILFWCWTGPLILMTFLMMYLTRKQFNVRIYFLD
jgi:putative peptidoglycan lipid II flippase